MEKEANNSLPFPRGFILSPTKRQTKRTSTHDPLPGRTVQLQGNLAATFGTHLISRWRRWTAGMTAMPGVGTFHSDSFSFLRPENSTDAVLFVHILDMSNTLVDRLPVVSVAAAQHHIGNNWQK